MGDDMFSRAILPAVMAIVWALFAIFGLIRQTVLP